MNQKCGLPCRMVSQGKFEPLAAFLPSDAATLPPFVVE
jgi:hypothetical protein